MIEYISNPYRSNLFTCSKYGFLALGFFFMYLNQLIKAIIYYFTQQNKSATAVIVVVVTNILI